MPLFIFISIQFIKVRSFIYFKEPLVIGSVVCKKIIYKSCLFSQWCWGREESESHITEN